MPAEWLIGIPSAPLPRVDTAGNWADFAQSQTAQLDRANSRTKDSVGIVKACEARDAETVKRLTKRPWWKLFG